MDPNPYESPKTADWIAGFSRHACPNCGMKVSFNRRFFGAHIWARWPCKGCGRTLRFDFGRRLLGALVGGSAIGAAGFCLIRVARSWFFAIPVGLAVFVVLAWAFLWIDTIRLADPDS